MKYKLSVFNYYFNFDEKTIGVFNTFTGSIMGLQTPKFQKFKNFSENNEALEPEVERSLLSNGFIVPYILNEYDVVNTKRIMHLINPNVSVYRILTTTDCNARCFYCYEGTSSHEYMDLKTAEQTINFILEHIENRKCAIEWFGGEPLMNTEIINYISQKLKNKLSNEKFHSTLVTNASLASPNIIEKMKEKWNLHLIQITLDGFSQEYKRRKNYVSIENPFELVIGNIKNILRAGINVSLRLNYDKNNYRDLCRLIRYLREENFSTAKNFSIYAYPIFSSRHGFMSEATGWEEWFDIQNSLIENGFMKHLEAFSLLKREAQCFACSPKSFVIMPNGTLYKCSHAMKDVSAQVGDIWNGVTNYGAMDKWCDTSLSEACSHCCFLPICQAGCRAGILGYTSDLCLPQKNFIDNVLRERIKYLRCKK